eukprot:752163-Hanusia_phi.AAC.5
MMRDLLIAYDLRVPDAYLMAAFYLPQRILRRLQFDDKKEALPPISFSFDSKCNCSTLCCLAPPKIQWETDELIDPSSFQPYPADHDEQIEENYQSLNLCNYTSERLQSCKEPVRIPHDCKDVLEAMDLINAAAREGVSEEFEILVCGPRNFAWQEKVHTIPHVPDWVNLEELTQQPFVRRRNLDGVSGLYSTPDPPHPLAGPRPAPPAHSHAEDSCAVFTERSRSLLVHRRNRNGPVRLGRGGCNSLYQPGQQDQGSPHKVLRRPPLRISSSEEGEVGLISESQGDQVVDQLNIKLRGPPNVQMWGEWFLSSISSGTIVGMTFSTVFHYLRQHEPMEDYTDGGEWNFTHVDIRVGAGGVLLTKKNARTYITWSCIGGLDDADFRAINGLVVIDSSLIYFLQSHSFHPPDSFSSTCLAQAVVLEFCGLQSGTAVLVTNSAVFRGQGCLFQHNYNHVQIRFRADVSLSNCSFWNHSSTLWVGHEYCDEEAVIRVDRAAVYGSLWRNDWKPAIFESKDLVEYSRAARPDKPRPSAQKKVRPSAAGSTSAKGSGYGSGSCGSCGTS